MALNQYLKTMVAPGNYIYTTKWIKCIKDRDNVEKYDFLFITIYVIHTDTYQLDNE